MKTKYLIFLVFFFSNFFVVFAQERKEVQGKVVAKFYDLEGIYVENISARKNTTTEKGGYFKIEMQPNDTLIFASINLKGIRRVVKETDFSKRLMFVPMEVSETTLDEMIIDRKITAESLGLAPRKKYTRAEKKLHTATSVSSANGIAFSIDGIVNALSGRTAMLKKVIEYERDEILTKQLVSMFEEDYFTSELKIPKVYIQGFGYYLIQDETVLAAMRASKKDELKFLITQKAGEYLEIIKVLE